MGWRFPMQDVVVMDFLESTLDEGVYVGTWYPDHEFDGPVVIVERAGHDTLDETRYASVEITVDAGHRGRSRQLAFDIGDELRELGGGMVGSILIDDVAEDSGAEPVSDVDDEARAESMKYTLAFRKHYFPEEEN